MATVFAKVNDQAAAPTQDPTEVTVDIATQTGVTGSQLGTSPTAGTTLTHPQMGYAGAVAVVDDTAYVDTGDGLVGAASRFFPGSGAAKGYENEAKVAKSQGGVVGGVLDARGLLTTVRLVADGDTVTIGGTTYTFQTTLVDTADNVLIDAAASISATLANLTAAINAGPGIGTLYGTGTVIHPDVSAVSGADQLAVTAKIGGTAANAVVTTETLTDTLDGWDDATLVGGRNGNFRAALGPVGQTPDVKTIMGLA